MLSKFGGKEDADAGQVMELVPGEAPEPVPDRKTSDEVIVEMAESTLENTGSRMAASDAEPGDVPTKPAPENGEGEPVEPAPVFEEDPAEGPAPEFDDWTEEAAPVYEDETDGIREE